MNIKKYLKSLLYILVCLLSFSLLLTILSYFNIIGSNTLKYLKLISLITSLFIGGLYIGKHASKKGYMEGLKIGAIMVILIMLLNYLGFESNFSIGSILYYLIILTSSILGSILGINKRLSNQT